MRPFKFFHGYVDDWSGHFTLPFVRRMAGRTITNELIQVQPMDGPTGRLFYMNYTYNETV